MWQVSLIKISHHFSCIQHLLTPRTITKQWFWCCWDWRNRLEVSILDISTCALLVRDHHMSSHICLPLSIITSTPSFAVPHDTRCPECCWCNRIPTATLFHCLEYAPPPFNHSSSLHKLQVRHCLSSPPQRLIFLSLCSLGTMGFIYCL